MVPTTFGVAQGIRVADVGGVKNSAKRQAALPPAAAITAGTVRPAPAAGRAEDLETACARLMW
jgi:hypothetical protein